ncbi:ABC transporter permease [Enterococcus ureilyticus]|uniref:ABC transporter permease n=1 Tax=Enterococcus ureilyticus TaxID=1131292 RepID=UPI001A92C017|nr:ABC transporter permease [Enterococcus ureilyticus]MBO0447289.1 ABC transporter permease [Enterococcus ureilyticus]
MRFSEIWKTSLKSILKNKRRSFLTMIGLIIGVSSVITIFSIGRGFERYATDFIGLDNYDSSVYFNFAPKDQSFYETNLASFSEIDFERIENVDGVKSVEYYDNEEKGAKYYSQQIDEASTASTQGSFKLLGSDGTETIYGRKIKSTDNINRNKVIVINETIAKAIKKDNPESLIGKSVTIQGQLFEVIGIMEDRDNSGFISTQEDYVVVEVPSASYEEYFESPKDSILVKLDTVADPKLVTKDIEKMLDKYGSLRNMGAYESQDLAGQVSQLRMILTGITAIVSIIGGISLFISGIGVMNMIYISVSERTKEIGVRRAMGGTKNNIMMQFLLEGITLTLIGGAIGYAFGMLIGYVVGMVTPFTIVPDFFTAMLALILSIGIGIIFSWLPAKSAAKKDIVSLIR